MKEREMVSCEFLKSYIAPRGAGIAGAEGDIKQFRSSAQLAELIEAGVLKVAKATKADTRKKATKKAAEKS